MATILYAWELGGGLGHILRFRPLAEKLIARGHRVIAALRELKNAGAIVAGRSATEQPPRSGGLHSGIEYLPAPHLSWRIPDPIEPTRTYADLLHNVGFAHVEDLRILMRAWQAIFELAQPDVVLCDHSPTALLAASLDGIPCATIGTGFCCPPVAGMEEESNGMNSVLRETLPDLRPWMRASVATGRRNATEGVPYSGEAVAADRTGGNGLRAVPKCAEERALANINAIRAEHGKPSWERLGQLYSSAAETFLTTFAELDHFAPRTDARYLGAWESEHGRTFEWPSGWRGQETAPQPPLKRVFLYTHRFPARDWLLEELRRRGFPTVAYTHDLPQAIADKLAGPTMHISQAPLDVAQAAAECDFAIFNSGHNSCAQLLLAGKPLLLLPIALEQGLLMRRLTSQGLAVSAPPDRPPAIAAALDDILANPRYRAAAQAFAAKYAAYGPQAAQDEIVRRIETMLNGKASAASAQ